MLLDKFVHYSKVSVHVVVSQALELTWLLRLKLLNKSTRALSLSKQLGVNYYQWQHLIDSIRWAKQVSLLLVWMIIRNVNNCCRCNVPGAVCKCVQHNTHSQLTWRVECNRIRSNMQIGQVLTCAQCIAVNRCVNQIFCFRSINIDNALPLLKRVLTGNAINHFVNSIKGMNELGMNWIY